MADYKKQVLSMPDLPTAIQGDGRQLISLLRKYLKSVNEQVNVANGFTADDVDASNKGDFQMPRNFTLTFDRLGGVMNWDSIENDDLAYYELRTNANVGNANGLLERTTATSSLVIPPTASGKIYLFAVSKEGKVSNGRTLSYNKVDLTRRLTYHSLKTMKARSLPSLKFPQTVSVPIYISTALNIKRSTMYICIHIPISKIYTSLTTTNSGKVSVHIFPATFRT